MCIYNTENGLASTNATLPNWLGATQPATSFFDHFLQSVPRPAGGHSLCSMSWVLPGVSAQSGKPIKPHMGDVQVGSLQV